MPASVNAKTKINGSAIRMKNVLAGIWPFTVQKRRATMMGVAKNNPS
jgi:hypothetical protein